MGVNTSLPYIIFLKKKKTIRFQYKRIQKKANYF